MAQLTTPRLLAYKRRLMRLEERVEGSDWEPRVLEALDPGLIYFKSDERWNPLCDAVKRELALREHVPQDAHRPRQGHRR